GSAPVLAPCKGESGITRDARRATRPSALIPFPPCRPLRSGNAAGYRFFPPERNRWLPSRLRRRVAGSPGRRVAGSPGQSARYGRAKMAENTILVLDCKSNMYYDSSSASTFDQDHFIGTNGFPTADPASGPPALNGAK